MAGWESTRPPCAGPWVWFPNAEKKKIEQIQAIDLNFHFVSQRKLLFSVRRLLTSMRSFIIKPTVPRRNVCIWIYVCMYAQLSYQDKCWWQRTKWFYLLFLWIKILPQILRSAPQVKSYQHQWVSQQASSGLWRCGSLCFLLPGKMNTQQTGLETPPTLTPGKSPKLQGPSTPGGGRLGRKRMQAGRWEGSPSSEASPMSKRLAGAFSSFFPPCPLTHHSSTPNLPFEEEQMEPLGPAMATTSH